MKILLAQVAEKSRTWIAGERQQFKEAAKTFIEETEENAKAKMAKERALLEGQKMVELRKTLERMKREMNVKMRRPSLSQSFNGQ